jgi:iron complex transport system ATP-binding protein
MSGGAALVVLHDLAMAARFERVLVLDDGRLVGDGSPLDLLTSERLRETWGVAGRLVVTDGGAALRLERWRAR